jgi:hypothetical protein
MAYLLPDEISMHNKEFPTICLCFVDKKCQKIIILDTKNKRPDSFTALKTN